MVASVGAQSAARAAPAKPLGMDVAAAAAAVQAAGMPAAAAALAAGKPAATAAGRAGAQAQAGVQDEAAGRKLALRSSNKVFQRVALLPMQAISLLDQDAL